MVAVVAVAFVKGAAYDPVSKTGDFEIMVARAQHDDLIVFNDNFADRNSSDPGGGNAVIRPYARMSPPRTIGVPTGWRTGKGFDTLGSDAQKVIDCALERVAHHIKTFAVRRVFYSATSPDDSTLGTHTLKVGADVVKYITRALQSLTYRVPFARELTIIDAAELALEATCVRSRAHNSSASPLIASFLTQPKRNASTLDLPSLPASKRARLTAPPTRQPTMGALRQSDHQVADMRADRDATSRGRGGADLRGMEQGADGATDDRAPIDGQEEPAVRQSGKKKKTTPSKKAPSEDAQVEEQRNRIVGMIGFDPRTIASTEHMEAHMRALAIPKPPPKSDEYLRSRYAPLLDALVNPFPQISTPGVLSIFAANDFDALGNILPDDVEGEDVDDTAWGRKIANWNELISHTSSASSSS